MITLTITSPEGNKLHSRHHMNELREFDPDIYHILSGGVIRTIELVRMNGARMFYEYAHD